MAISLFKKPPTDARPCTAELQTHRREITALLDAREVVTQRHARARRDIEAAATAAAQITQMNAAIDDLIATAKYDDRAAPDLTEQRRALAQAQRNYESLAGEARAAETVSKRCAAELIKLNEQLRALQDRTPRLVHGVAVEGMTALAADFREKEEAFREVYRKVFAHVALADQIAMSEHLPTYYGVGLFGELHIPRPQHGAFQRGSADPWTAQQERNTEARAIDVEAERLKQQMLTGETD